MKKRKINKTMESTLFVGSVIIGIFLGIGLTFFIMSIPAKNPSDVNSSICSESDLSSTNNCSGMSLFMTSDCLKNELSKWYNYNLSNVNRQLNLDQLKSEGGVCVHYARWYRDNFVNLGFQASYVSFDGNDVGHIITLAWTKNLTDGGYCIADQLNVWCSRLGNINITLLNQEVAKNDKFQ